MTPEPTIPQDNHVNDVVPEVISSPITEDGNHVTEDADDDAGTEKDEAVESSSASKSGSQIKLKYDYKDGMTCYNICRY